MQQQRRFAFGGGVPNGGPRGSSFSIFGDRLEPFRSAPQFGRTVTIGNQSFREVDNGRANTLVPVYDAEAAGELRKRREGFERAQYMAGHPFAGAAYGVASAMGVSPRTRDRALAAGGIADSVMHSGAPLGAPIGRRMTAPPKSLSGPSLAQAPIRYRGVNENNQAGGSSSMVTSEMLGTGKRAKRSLSPPGWQGNGRVYNEARGHLHAKSLGGRGDSLEEVVTLTQTGANSPQMSKFERGVALRAKAGEVVDYSVTPIYDSGVLPPALMFLMASGTRGNPRATIITNPAGRRK